jgi:hypothetical protein
VAYLRLYAPQAVFFYLNAIKFAWSQESSLQWSREESLLSKNFMERRRTAVLEKLGFINKTSLSLSVWLYSDEPAPSLPWFADCGRGIATRCEVFFKHPSFFRFLAGTSILVFLTCGNEFVVASNLDKEGTSSPALDSFSHYHRRLRSYR